MILQRFLFIHLTFFSFNSIGDLFAEVSTPLSLSLSSRTKGYGFHHNLRGIDLTLRTQHLYQVSLEDSSEAYMHRRHREG